MNGPDTLSLDFPRRAAGRIPGVGGHDKALFRDHGYTSRPTDTPANVHFEGRPLSPFVLEQAAELGRAAASRATLGVGAFCQGEPGLRSEISHAGDAIGFRNVLIHGYLTIDHDRVWRIAQSALPELRRGVSALLERLGPPDR